MAKIKKESFFIPHETGGSEHVSYSTAEQEAVATWPFRRSPLNGDLESLVECYLNGQVATASCSAVEWS